MIFYTITEKWNYNHTNEFRILLHLQLDRMEAQGKFVKNKINNDRSVYDIEGSPTKIFTSEQAANEYIDWLKKYHDEFETIIKKFESEADLNDYLNSIHDVNHFKKTDSGPSQEEKYNYYTKNNLWASQEEKDNWNKRKYNKNIRT